jgi:hypothetical protein
MRDTVSSIVIIGALLSAACGSRGTVHTAPDESRPHITWDISIGGEFGEGTVVCGSTKPGVACVLPASTPSRPTLSALRLYLHAAARQTNYVGAWRAPFLQGWTASDYRDVSGTVQPGADPFVVNVNGNVTSKPGRYTFSVLLDGAQEGVPAGNRIVLDVPVEVRAAGSLSLIVPLRTGRPGR